MLKKIKIFLFNYLNNFTFWCINISLILFVFFYQFFISDKQKLICILQIDKNFKLGEINNLNENFSNKLILDINNNAIINKDKIKVINYFEDYKILNNDLIHKHHFKIQYINKQIPNNLIKNNLISSVKNLNKELLNNSNYLASVSNIFIKSMYYEKKNNINLKLENLPSYQKYQFIEDQKKKPIFNEEIKIEDCQIIKNSKLKLIVNSILLILILNITYFFYKLKKKSS